MKLFILKLLSLLVLCLGLISLAYYIGFAPVTDFLAQAPAQLAVLQGNLPAEVAWAKGLLDIKILWLIASITAFVFGAYGLAPRSGKWKKPKKICYDGPHGQVLIQLDTVEQSLNNVLSRMPEVKKIDVCVEPRDGGRSALIKANAVLQHQPGQNARAIAGLVSDYIAETATKMLGLEELATIELNVTGINVNSRKSSKAIRKESLSHSGNAPVELLEAAPKPMALSAPGGPLGSGPIEEEMEEEEDTDHTYDARAIDSAEEESNQAAARSELLEPLNLHPVEEEPEEEMEATEDQGLGESGAETEAADDGESEDEEEEEEPPAIVEPSVDGASVNATVVPMPLGDLEDDSEQDDDESPEGLDEGDTALDSDGDDDGSVEIPEAVETHSAPEEEFSSESLAPNSPWAPLASDTEVDPVSADVAVESDENTEDEASDVDPSEGADASVLADAATDDDGEPNLMDSESSDSIIGDLEEEDSDNAMAPADGTDEESPRAAAEPSEGGEKKGWGWFN